MTHWLQPFYDNVHGSLSRSDQVFDLLALESAVNGSPPALYSSFHGTLVDDVDIENIVDVTDTAIVSRRDTLNEEVQFWAVNGKSTYLEAYLNLTDRSATIEIVTRNPDHQANFNEWGKAHISDHQPPNYCYTITQSSQGMTTSYLDSSGAPLELDNYTDEVVAQYQAVVADLSSDEPAGRIAIIDGPTGTGKTHMVRGLIHDVADAMFLLVPPGMVESLVGPGMINLLLEIRDSNRPIVILLEDSDDALVPRDGGNISLISTLLNLGDGIVGQALNIRIICTTNAPADKIDSAIMRPGRLIEHIHVGKLMEDKAQQVLNRIVPDGKAKLPKRRKKKSSVGFGAEETVASYSIAEIYEAARKSCKKAKVKGE